MMNHDPIPGINQTLNNLQGQMNAMTNLVHSMLDTQKKILDMLSIQQNAISCLLSFQGLNINMLNPINQNPNVSPNQNPGNNQINKEA